MVSRFARVFQSNPLVVFSLTSIDHLAFLNHVHYQGNEHNLNIPKCGVVTLNSIRALQSHSAFKVVLKICKSFNQILLLFSLSYPAIDRSSRFLKYFHYQGFEHNLNIVDLRALSFSSQILVNLVFFFFPRRFLLQDIILQVRKIVVLFSQEVFFNTRELA